MSAAARARMQATEPAGLAAFEAKVAAATAAANSTARVVASSTATWDVGPGSGKPEPTLVVLQTTTVPPTESWIELTVPTGMRGVQGNVPTPRPQTYTMELEPTFFVDEPPCLTACDPDRWNPLRLRREVLTANARKAFSLTDITTATARPVARKPGPAADGDSDRSEAFTLEDLGYDAQKPASKYALRLEPTLQAIDGQTLGYPWIGVVENWHATAFTSFGDGHGVWESTGGTVLPFYARNFTTVRQWVAAIAPLELMPTILALQGNGFKTTPDADAAEPPSDAAGRSHPVVRHRPGARPHRRPRPGVGGGRGGADHPAIADLRRRAADARHGRPGHQPRPDRQGQPAEHAGVRDAPRQRPAGRGRQGVAGHAREPGRLDRHDQRRRRGDRPGRCRCAGRSAGTRTKFEFLVTAEKDGDLAYLGSDWTEGIDPWEFGINYDSAEQHSLLRGTVFADRGVYRLGEEVHYKAILRHDTATGIKVPDAGTPVYVSVRDSQDREIDQREVKLSAWGSVEWTQTLPAEGALGNYSVLMRLRPFTDRDEEALDGAGAAAERRGRGRERSPTGVAAARLGQRRLPRRGLPPARLPRRRDADQRDAVRRHDADGHA